MEENIIKFFYNQYIYMSQKKPNARLKDVDLTGQQKNYEIMHYQKFPQFVRDSDVKARKTRAKQRVLEESERKVDFLTDLRKILSGEKIKPKKKNTPAVQVEKDRIQQLVKEGKERDERIIRNAEKVPKKK